LHFKNQEDYKVWADQQEKGAIGGGIFTPQGPEDYVGAIPAIRAVLYFKEGYSAEMREKVKAKIQPSIKQNLYEIV